ncbi:MAG: reverse transcriptase domain-containing protein, partial [Rectinemataceae bacterium]|nr:reverse transcriptase domain-containing protein [Rectinemataceae bacterium]
MSISGMMWLIAVVDDLGLTMVTFLSNKGAIAIRDSVVSFIDYCKSHGWVVSLRCDNERSFIKAIELLATRARFITSEIVSPGSHVPIVERKIRTIKEKVRSVINGLPYDVPKFLLKWIVDSVVRTSNMLTDKSVFTKVGDFRSPRERFTGKRTDVAKHVRLAVGQYVHTYDTNNANPSSMQSRSLGCICLGSLANDAGTYSFWNLASNSIIHRSSWVIVPISDIVVKTINDYAKGSKSDVDLPTEDLLDPAAPITEPRQRSKTKIPDQPPRNHNPYSKVPAEIPAETVASAETNETEVSAESEVAEDASPDPPVDATESQVDITAGEEPEMSAGNVEPETPEALTPSVTEDADTRYPGRANRGVPAERYGFHVKMTDAVQRLGPAAMNSIMAELTNVIQYDALEPILAKDVPRKQRIIRSSLFLKEKMKPDGSFDKLKSRFVAGGHLQDRSQYAKEETSSPTVALGSLFVLSTLAAKESRKVVTVDVQSAYLNADIIKPVFMRIEPALAHIACIIRPDWKCFQDPGGAMVVKLKKALYGCVESSALWYQDLTATIISAGLEV